MIGLLQRFHEFVEIVRLFQIFECPELGTFNGRINGGVSGQHDDFNELMLLLENFQNLGTIHAGHLEVQNRYIEAALFGGTNGPFAIIRGRYGKPFEGQPLCNGL